MRWIIIFLLAAAVVAIAAPATSPPPIECMTADEREHIRGLMVKAIDDAFRAQIEHLFEIWMKDDRDQPRRAGIGGRTAVRAYLGSRRFVADWSPPLCP